MKSLLGLKISIDTYAFFGRHYLLFVEI